jgi:hypothetical protein
MIFSRYGWLILSLSANILSHKRLSQKFITPTASMDDIALPDGEEFFNNFTSTDGFIADMGEDMFVPATPENQHRFAMVDFQAQTPVAKYESRAVELSLPAPEIPETQEAEPFSQLSEPPKFSPRDLLSPSNDIHTPSAPPSFFNPSNATVSHSIFGPPIPQVPVKYEEGLSTEGRIVDDEPTEPNTPEREPVQSHPMFTSPRPSRRNGIFPASHASASNAPLDSVETKQEDTSFQESGFQRAFTESGSDQDRSSTKQSSR